MILWKEPEPLRIRFRRRPTEPHRWTQPQVTGGTGFIDAVVWSILTAAVGSSIGWLAPL